MKINRLLTNVCSQDLEQSKTFYTELFSFNVSYDSDWFVHLTSEGDDFELGIVRTDHEVVPHETRGDVRGAYLTFVVDDVDKFLIVAETVQAKIIQLPEVTSYGQKRMLLVAPEGTICDVSSPTD